MSSLFRRAFVALLTGALVVSVAWAGAGLVPVGGDPASETLDRTKARAPRAGRAGAADMPAALQQANIDLQNGQVLAGASKVSIEPRPDAYGGTWATEGCATFGGDAQDAPTHVSDFRIRWPENPNCIYMGGYSIGPANPITSWADPYGLWVRVVAIGDGEDTIVMSILDGTSYMGRYANMCDGCGALDLAEELGAELGIDPSGFFFASTHSHTAPDFIGGWGGVPQWYMDQVADSMRAAVRSAVSEMRPAVLETGEMITRGFNAERRRFYRSAEEQELTWFRLVEQGAPTPDDPTEAPGPAQTATARVAQQGNGKGPKPKPSESPSPSPSPSPEPEFRAIATVGAFAAHPVTADEGSGIADADFPGVFEKRVEDRFGGVGLFFQTGLGNMSPRAHGRTAEQEGAPNKVVMGENLGDLLPNIGGGRLVENPDVRSTAASWDQPVTNPALTALGVPGFFDRPFAQSPSQVSAGKNDVRKCNSASPISVTTGVSAAKVGSLWISGAPGETFANLTNTLKELNPGGVTMPLAQVNDGLGYIMQSFETDHAGRSGAGFAPEGDPTEYEDAYSLDACFGEMVLETTKGLLEAL